GSGGRGGGPRGRRCPPLPPRTPVVFRGAPRRDIFENDLLERNAHRLMYPIVVDSVAADVGFDDERIQELNAEESLLRACGGIEQAVHLFQALVGDGGKEQPRWGLVQILDDGEGRMRALAGGLSRSRV